MIELKVDEGILASACETRVAEMQARGEAPRADDNPEILHRRLLAYRDQTAPLTGYFQLQSVLRSVDGMATVDEVSRAIDTVLRTPKERRRQRRLQSRAPGNRGKTANKTVSKKAAAKPAAPKVNAPKPRKAERAPKRAETRRKAAEKGRKNPPTGRSRRSRRARLAARKTARPQKHSPAEVDEAHDESINNPGIQVEKSNDAGPLGSGGGCRVIVCGIR